MVADFSVNITSGNAELLVQFTDESLGIPTSWLWDFGDGSTSTEQNPFHLYTEPGSHTVTLTASRESGVGPYTDTEIKADLISVYTRAEFVGTPRVGYNNLTVQFADLSTGSPTTWFWSFGDGEYSTEVNPVHTYASPGAYSVQLTVSSSFNSDAEYKSNYIIVEGTATPDIAPEPDILLYLTGEVKSNKESKGIKVSFLRNKTS
jgi:PKD repeat protein